MILRASEPSFHRLSCPGLDPRLNSLLSPFFKRTEQRTGGDIQRGGQISHRIEDLARQESQVCEGDDEETHVEEIQQLSV